MEVSSSAPVSTFFNAPKGSGTPFEQPHPKRGAELNVEAVEVLVRYIVSLSVSDGLLIRSPEYRARRKRRESATTDCSSIITESHTMSSTVYLARSRRLASLTDP